MAPTSITHSLETADADGIGSMHLEIRCGKGESKKRERGGMSCGLIHRRCCRRSGAGQAAVSIAKMCGAIHSYENLFPLVGANRQDP